MILRLASVLVTAISFLSCAKEARNAVSLASEPTYERVIATKVLRCGYLVYPPEIVIDPNNGTISGWAHDIVERAASELGLRVAWVEQVTNDNMFEGLQSGRYDALCAGVWESPARSLKALFTAPVTYATYYPYVRMDDARFDSDLAQINDPAVKIAVTDGEYGEVVARERFPRASLHSLAPGTSYSLIFPDVASRKADVVFAVPATANLYLKNNPNTLKMLQSEVLAMPAPVISLRLGEQKLKNIVDSTVRHLLNTGVVHRIVTSYHPGDDQTHYPVAAPFAKRSN